MSFAGAYDFQWTLTLNGHAEFSKERQAQLGLPKEEAWHSSIKSATCKTHQRLSFINTTLNLGRGVPSQNCPSIYAKLLQSCKPQQLQREGLAGFAEFLGPVFDMFFFLGGWGGGKPFRDSIYVYIYICINPNNFLIIKLDSPQISEFNDPCLVSMNARRWWSPTYKA